MVDIIIPFFNKSELTIQCLKYVCHTASLDCRIVVVDDGSDIIESEKVRAYLHEGSSRFTFFRKEINQGYKEAIRTGMALCLSKYVILLNNDTIVTPGFDSRLIALLEENPRIKAAAPVSNHPTDLFQFRESLQHIKAAPGDLKNDDIVQRLNDLAAGLKKQVTIAPYLTGMCLALDRELFQQIGVFDDQYEHGYFEDLDLCCQIRKNGYQLAIAEDCFVFHYGHATYRQKPTSEKHRIIWNNFKIFSDRWSHISGHDELLLKMEFAGKNDPI